MAQRNTYSPTPRRRTGRDADRRSRDARPTSDRRNREARPSDDRRRASSRAASSPANERPSSATRRPRNTARSETGSRASANAPNRRPAPRTRTRDVYVGGNQGTALPIRPLALGILGAAALLVLLFVFIIPACTHTGLFADKPAEAAKVQPARITFAAVGDNLPSEYVGYYADRQAGKEGDDKYDYRAIYEPIKPSIENADIAYVDQEVHVGGNEIGPKGYPSFNTTDEMADAIVDAGFDFVASATNHAYDWGSFGALEHSLSVWEKQPVAFTGTAVTAEQYDRIATVEREGVTFALLNYTYAVGGYEKNELPKYAVNYIDRDRIKSDVARARDEAEADVVLVAMHWGTENLTEADDEQKSLAQFLADLDVDVVLGSHPHVIGPMAWVKNSNGDGHQTLVAYSLGNFVSDHESPNKINLLEGMLTCDFVKTPIEQDPSDASGESAGESGESDKSTAASKGFEISIENVKWTPLIMHSDEKRTEFAVYPVQDYPEDVAKENRLFQDEGDDAVTWCNETTADIIDAEFLETA